MKIFCKKKWSLIIPLLLLSLVVAHAQPQRVTGVVLDSNGDPIAGAAVLIAGTTTGTATNVDGTFELNAEEGATINFTYLGLHDVSLPAQFTSNMVVTLEEDNAVLDEVVVVGYGTQKKANLTGSVSSVSGDDIANLPASNVTSMLQGRMAGVTITQQTGQPGAESTSIRIRGVGTMNNSSPLVIVDGMEGDMSELNPNDIESISVLKDAAASAIYGTRAANGVILITTVRGVDTKTSVAYNGFVGFQNRINTPDPVDSWTYAEWYNEACRNDGISEAYTDQDIQLFKDGSSPYTHANTDWYSLLYSETGLTHKHNVSVKGGSENSRYAVSFGYYGQDGLLSNTSYERYNVRANVDSDITRKLKMGITSSLSYSDRVMPMNQTGTAYTNITSTDVTGLGDLYTTILRFNSTAIYQYEDGTYGTYASSGNPVTSTRDGGTITDLTARVNGNAYIQYEIIDGLTIKGVAGVNFINADKDTHGKEMTYYGGESIGYNFVKNSIGTDMDTTLQAFLNYNKSFGDHTVSGLLGVSRETWDYKYTMAFRRDMPTSDLTDLNAGSTDGQLTDGYTTAQRVGSYFGRINYDYKGKYLFEANVRHDGSSKFGSGYKWGTFPSFSAGWRLSEEDFFTSDWVDNIKVRGSWGKLGNHYIDDFIYLQRLSIGTTMAGNGTTYDSVYPFSDTLVTGVEQVYSNNEYITWETTTEWDLGVDLTFWGGKLDVTLDYYNRYTDDILTEVPVSYNYGLNAPTSNAGAMSNKGFEAYVAHRNKIGDFRYGVSATFAKNKNNVEVFETPSIGTSIIQEGIPYNSYYGYNVIGIFMNEEELESYPTMNASSTVGSLKYEDVNQDGTIDGDDRVVLGNNSPNITYSFNIELGYKAFDLVAYFQGAADVYGNYSNNTIFNAFTKGENAYEAHADRTIVEDGQVVSVGYFPAFTLDDTNKTVVSSFNVLKTDYLRLKNLQIGYTVPKSVTQKIKMESLRVYVSGTNLLTFDSLPDGLDPENMWTSYPQTSFYTLGLDVKF